MLAAGWAGEWGASLCYVWEALQRTLFTVQKPMKPFPHFQGSGAFFPLVRVLLCCRDYPLLWKIRAQVERRYGILLVHLHKQSIILHCGGSGGGSGWVKKCCIVWHRGRVRCINGCRSQTFYWISTSCLCGLKWTLANVLAPFRGSSQGRRHCGCCWGVGQTVPRMPLFKLVGIWILFKSILNS